MLNKKENKYKSKGTDGSTNQERTNQEEEQES